MVGISEEYDHVKGKDLRALQSKSQSSKRKIISRGMSPKNSVEHKRVAFTLERVEFEVSVEQSISQVKPIWGSQVDILSLIVQPIWGNHDDKSYSSANLGQSIRYLKNLSECRVIEVGT